MEKEEILKPKSPTSPESPKDLIATELEFNNVPDPSNDSRLLVQPEENEINPFIPQSPPSKTTLLHIQKGGDWADETESEIFQSKKPVPTLKKRKTETAQSTNPEELSSCETTTSFVNPNTPMQEKIKDILNNQQVVLDTFDKRISEAYNIARVNRELVQSHEELIKKLQNAEQSLKEANEESRRQISSLFQRQELMSRQLDRIKDEYLEYMKNVPQSLEKAFVSLNNMMQQVELAGLAPPEDAISVQNELKTQTKQVNESLANARATRDSINKTKKLPHHLQKYLKK